MFVDLGGFFFRFLLKNITFCYPPAYFPDFPIKLYDPRPKEPKKFKNVLSRDEENSVGLFVNQPIPTVLALCRRASGRVAWLRLWDYISRVAAIVGTPISGVFRFGPWAVPAGDPPCPGGPSGPPRLSGFILSFLF